MKAGILILLFIICFSPDINAVVKDDLRNGFIVPPDSTKPFVYWYLMNGHLSKEGITKDLEAMTRIGIGEVFLGNIHLTRLASGEVEIFTPEWTDCMRHAIKEGSRLGIRISFFNSPGWSQSGGPWIKPGQSMRYLTFSERRVQGGDFTTFEIARPADFFQDVVTLAFREEESEKRVMSFQSVPACDSLGKLFDGDVSTTCLFKNKQGQSVGIDLRFGEKTAARSLSIQPTQMSFSTTCEVFVEERGEYRSVKKHALDRLNKGNQLGPLQDAEIVISIDEVEGTNFRVVFHSVPANFELKNMTLSEKNRLEDYNEKWLHKLPHTWRPSWETYQWTAQQQKSQSGVINEHDVIDVSSFLVGDSLRWKAPNGHWRILRIGMTTTGTTNVPASPVATGLEVDKMNRKYLSEHYDAYIGQLVDGLTKDEKRSFKRIIADSYETGPQNWTDGMRQSFMDAYNYDPFPYLLSLAGVIVESAEKTDRFLWDIRRFIADKVANEYVGGLRNLCDQHNIRLWLENYGHWGFPSEFLKYGGQSHDIGGEFWTHGMNDFECRLAASACHIYGKNKVYAESFTSSGRYYERYPAELKRIGDWSYCEGVNQGVLHLYMHQPYSDRYPGVNAWFGIELNRNNTWFEQSKAWIDYQRRCYFMLQQGAPVVDICFFVGEDAPKMEGWKDKDMPSGFNYDFINAEVIENYLKVKNGRLYLPSGISYALMVLPPLTTMRPALLKKINLLVKEGAVILGTPPLYSPSLSNYPVCDEEVRNLAQQLWGNLNPRRNSSTTRKVGKGMVLSTISIQEALESMGVEEDVVTEDDSVLWTHRQWKDGDIYFLSNQRTEAIELSVSFRVKDRQPEYWNPMDGSTRKLPTYSNENGRTMVPIRLHGGESCFIVFREKVEPQRSSLKVVDNFPIDKWLFDIPEIWDIHFRNKWLGVDFSVEKQSLFDWTESAHTNIKHFSGSATYSTKFQADQVEGSLFLCFDDIKVIATIKLNGKELGTIWHPPYRINITDALQIGENTLEVIVTNLWVNQLVYQAQQKQDEKSTWLLEENMDPNQSLQSSGLMGRVWVVSNIQ